MKIMQIAGGINSIGGIEMFVRRLSGLLCRQGHDTVIVTSDPPREATPYRTIRTGHFTTASEAARSSEAEILSLVESYRPDVILSHTTANARLLMALNERCPTVEFVHVFLCAGGKLFRRTDHLCTHAIGPRCLADWYAGPCGSHRSPRVMLKAYRTSVQHRDALKHLPAVLVATDFMRDYLIGEGLAPERVYVAEYNTDIPPEGDSAPPGTNLLFVGRATYSKGVQYALEALKSLGPAYRLTVVGDGYYLPTLKQIAARLGVQDRVEFTGFLQGEALEAAYRKANIALVPSIWPEPAGLVVPEARGRGLPVVAFAVGGIPEWSARYGYSAVYLASTVTAEALVEAITHAAQQEPAAPARPVTPSESVAQILAKVVSVEAFSQSAAPSGENDREREAYP